MNKLSKGLIVSGLGVALLLGTGGSLALWNVNAESNAGVINTGDLNLAVAESGQTWEIMQGGSWTTVADITTFKMVPGDQVRLTQPMDVTLVGNHMKANLTVDTSEAVAGDPSAADLFTVETSFLAPDNAADAPSQVGSTNTWAFDGPISGTGTATFEQQIVFTFLSTATDRDGALSSISLADTNFVLEQVAI